MDEISIDDRERTKKKKQKVIIEEKKRDPDGKKKGKRRIPSGAWLSSKDIPSRLRVTGEEKTNPRFEKER